MILDKNNFSLFLKVKKADYTFDFRKVIKKKKNFFNPGRIPTDKTCKGYVFLSRCSLLAWFNLRISNFCELYLG